ncbi:hypothetical protein ACIRF8_08760 [Streptomyces sp. NPDC102406]|uniref:hypothetical protein n=1 Tax=Streptomyces sp. NPDC102406 TaxID=3366171 RepID=UPI00382849D6
MDAAAARAWLRQGAAVVLPNPEPLTYTVAATRPDAVNTAKGRPARQAVALWAHDRDILTALEGVLTLDTARFAVARRLLVEERVTLLVPLRADVSVPAWLAPAAKDGWALLFGARWAPLLPVLADFSTLYVSSANRTGRPPAATATDALAMFSPHTPVLDSMSLAGAGPDPLQASPGPRSATTTLRLHSDGLIDLHRSGAQDRAYTDTEEYLSQIRSTYR